MVVYIPRVGLAPFLHLRFQLNIAVQLACHISDAAAVIPSQITIDLRHGHVHLGAGIER